MPPYLSDVLNTFVTEDHLFIATVVFYHKAADIARNFSTAILPASVQPHCFTITALFTPAQIPSPPDHDPKIDNLYPDADSCLLRYYPK